MAEKCFQPFVSDSLTSTNILMSPAEIKNLQKNKIEFYDTARSSPPELHSETDIITPLEIISRDNSTSLDDHIEDENTNAINPSTQIQNTHKSCEEKVKDQLMDHGTVGIFIETPIVDENNVTLTGHKSQKVAAKPKRICEDFFSSDDGEDDRNEASVIDDNEDEVSTIENIQCDENSTENFRPETVNEFIVEEESSLSCIILKNEESQLIKTSTNLNDSLHKTVQATDATNSGNSSQEVLNNPVDFCENDVQSMDAIERKDFIQEQNLNLEYLESYRQTKKVSSESNRTSNQKEMSSTPTSSRWLSRLTKSTVKQNLSATLDGISSGKYIIEQNDQNENVSNNKVKLPNSGNSSTCTEESPAVSQCLKIEKSLDTFLNSNSDDSSSSDKSYNTSSNHSLPNHFVIKTNPTELSYRFINIVPSNHIKEVKVVKSENRFDNNIMDSIAGSYSDPIPSTSSRQYVSYCCEDSARAAKRDALNSYKNLNDKMSSSNLGLLLDKKTSTSTTSSPKNKQICNFNAEGQNSLSSGSSRSSRADNRNFEDRVLEHSEISLPTEQTDDFDEETWEDCDDGSEGELCTCNFSTVSSYNFNEDELPSNDFDLSCFMPQVTISEDIYLNENTSDALGIQRKRKLNETRVTDIDNSFGETSSNVRKRVAMQCITSRTPLPHIVQPSVLLSSPTTSIERRTPRSLIPTKDNPPPELQNWISIFQRWSHVERLIALDRLIEHCEPTQVRHMMKVIEPQFQRDFISLLPRELALQVLSYLDPNDLLRAAQTCRSWRYLCDDNLLWKEKCKQAQIMTEPNSDRPKRGRAGNMPPISSPWKAAYMRQHIIEMNWRSRPIRQPKVLKGHDDHVITCLQFHGNRIVSGSDDNTLKVWSAVNGKCLRTLVGHTGGVWSSQMSGNIIISGSTDRTLKVWDMESGRCIHTLQGHTSTVRCMHLHGNKVVSGSRDATLRVWDIERGACLHVLVGHLAAVRCVQYDGKLIVSGAYDYMVKVWNPERQECLHTLQGHTNRVYSLQFDGIHVVSGSLDTSIRVWDAETGSCKHTLMGHQSLTSGMELRQNILVSGNADSTVKVWDITSGQCLQTLSGPNKHQSAVTCLQFNSRFVITSSDDGTVKLWDVKTGEFIRNLVALDSGGSGGVVWRIRASDTKLICAVGSRNGTEETKLMVLDFDVDGACAKCS